MVRQGTPLGRRWQPDDASALPVWPEAACRGVDTAVFFRDDGESTLSWRRRSAWAKALCAVCPVRSPCLAWALERGELGVWGGTTENEREALVKSGRG